MTTNEQLDLMLMALLGSKDLVELWWKSPNKAFDNKHPSDVELSEVKKYLMWHCYGGDIN